MKILIIGATGTIGKAVAQTLSADHQIIRAGYSDGDVRVDLGNPESIREMFATTGKVDAVISTAGLAGFAPLAQLQDSDYQLALNNKVMGQINLIRLGSAYITDGGSVTLTSGILSKEPIPGSASIAMANGALESYVLAAALEENRINLNVVAPAFVKETMEMMGMDSSTGISAADTARAYAEALTGHHGETLDVRDHI